MYVITEKAKEKKCRNNFLCGYNVGMTDSGESGDGQTEGI